MPADPRLASIPGKRDTSRHVKRILTCGVEGCSRSFSRLDHLRRHQLNHGDKSLECLICQRSFRRRDILAKHLRAHSTSETEATGVEVTRNSEESVEETLQEADAEAGPDAASFINETAGFDMNDYLQEEAFDTTGNATLSFPRLFAGENSFGFVDDDYLFNYDPISFIRNLQPVLEDESEIGRREMVLSMPAIPSQHETANDFTNFNITSSLSLESLPQLLEALPSNDRLRQCLSTLDTGILNTWLRSYWENFHPQLPLVHEPTFYPQLENQGLLLMILAIGEACMNMPSRHLSWIGTALRSKILLDDFGPNLSLETLQCLVLSCYFDLFLSHYTNDQFSAECFIATLVAYARRTSAMVKQEKAMQLASMDAGQVNGLEWMQWVGEEMKTRAAYAIIALDSFLPLLRGQLPSRRYTIFAVQLPLPALEREWAARSAADWYLLIQTRMHGSLTSRSEEEELPDESFHPALNPNYEPPTTQPGLSTEIKKCLGVHMNQAKHDGWSCFLLLISISTIVWDAQKAQPLGSFHSAEGQSVRASVHVSCQALVSSAERSALRSQRFLEDTLFLVDIRVFADVVALQMVSGRATIGGGKPSARHYQTALNNVTQWTTSEEAELAVALSARYVESHLVSGSEVTSLLTPWAVYCAAMCLYCFQTVSPARSTYAYAQIESMLVNCLNVLEGLSCADATEGTRCLQDMLTRYRSTSSGVV